MKKLRELCCLLWHGHDTIAVFPDWKLRCVSCGWESPGWRIDVHRRFVRLPRFRRRLTHSQTVGPKERGAW